MTRVAIYARFSSDLQKAVSIEDQLRICKERAIKEGWTIAETYTDYAISGDSALTRPSYQKLLRDVMAGKFDIVLSESLDRLSRDQEDTAALYKRTQFAGVIIHTLSEGVITSLHIGLKGTMNAMYRTDLRDKVKRGQRGRVENGKMGGGNCYGYDVVKRLDDRGEKVHGERTINAEEAKIVERIFRDYAAGQSPKTIANALNTEGISGPAGRGWGPSTIYGNWQRGAGILNNELYIGWIVWNKVSYPKNPDTARQVSRINPESEWVRSEVPELRIISQELWDQVKARQKRGRLENKPFWQHQRPRYLLSNRLKCGVCGGGMAKVSAHHYGCSTFRNKGKALCTNPRTIRQDRLEATVLRILQDNLMDPKLIEVFCREYTAHVNRMRMEHNASLAGYRTELEKLKRCQKRIVQAVMDGFATEDLKRESNAVVEREKELEALLARTREAPTLLHPRMADRYRSEIVKLIDSLRDDGKRHEAVEAIQGLVEKVVLTPDRDSDGLLIDLYGDLAGILNVTTKPEKGKQQQQEIDLKQIRLVVGLDNQPSNNVQGKVVDTEAHLRTLQGRNPNPKQQRRRTGNSHSQEVISVVQDKMVGPAGLEPATRPL